jgi:hypothetical protein
MMQFNQLEIAVNQFIHRIVGLLKIDIRVFKNDKGEPKFIKLLVRGKELLICEKFVQGYGNFETQLGLVEVLLSQLKGFLPAPYKAVSAVFRFQVKDWQGFAYCLCKRAGLDVGVESSQVWFLIENGYDSSLQKLTLTLTETGLALNGYLSASYPYIKDNWDIVLGVMFLLNELFISAQVEFKCFSLPKKPSLRVKDLDSPNLEIGELDDAGVDLDILRRWRASNEDDEDGK